MTYKHLTYEQRYQIIPLKRSGYSIKKIADKLNVHPSTIYRELNRHRDERGCYYKRKVYEQVEAKKKRCAQNARKISAEAWSQVEEKLNIQWSPEQISQFVKVSHESIYLYIYRDKEKGGKLYRQLRQKRTYRRMGGRRRRKKAILNAVSIEHRPAIVEERRRIGDIEIDTIIGVNRKSALLTVVDRKSGFTLIKKMTNLKGKATAQALIELLAPIKTVLKTITSDNGGEFSEHKEVSEALEIEYYFAHPYSPWERGTNENTNGLIRQYFPKGTDFTNISDAVIIAVMERLNNRPRKRLGYKTPNQVFYKKGFALRT